MHKIQRKQLSLNSMLHSLAPNYPSSIFLISNDLFSKSKSTIAKDNCDKYLLSTQCCMHILIGFWRLPFIVISYRALANVVPGGSLNWPPNIVRIDTSHFSSELREFSCTNILQPQSVSKMWPLLPSTVNVSLSTILSRSRVQYSIQNFRYNLYTFQHVFTMLNKKLTCSIPVIPSTFVLIM